MNMMTQPEVKFIIEFPRGDSYQKGILLKRNGVPIEDTFDEVYFTVKKKHQDYDVCFQKRMSTGGIVSDGNGHYTIFIQPEDSNQLDFGDYDCDIELKRADYKRTFYGKLKLTKEVTHYYNEG